MATPWRHPETQVYYLYRQIPEQLRPHFGRRFWKVSLKTRDPREAQALFTLANAELEHEFERAREALAKHVEANAISAFGATAAVASTYPPSEDDPYPALWMVYWLEEAACGVLGSPSPGIMPARGDDGRFTSAWQVGQRLPGEAWITLTEAVAKTKWLPCAEAALTQIAERAIPQVVRTPHNDELLADAFNDAVRQQRDLLLAELKRPTQWVRKSRLRPAMKLRELYDEWVESKDPGEQFKHEVSGFVNDLIDFVGNVPVSTLTGDMLCDYRDAAAELPRNMPRADRQLRFTERLARHPKGTGPRIDATTLKKRMGGVGALLSLAFTQRWIAHNMGAGIPIIGYEKSKGGRRSFRSAELKRLFESELFLEPALWAGDTRVVSRITLYWLFLFGLTCGARIEEIGQALLNDVQQDGAITFIDIDDYAEAVVENEKHLKNSESRRVIPVHDLLIKLGFLAYRDALAESGAARLFPDLVANQFNKVSKEASRSANRYIDKHVGTTARLVFHSLRHTFKTLGRNAKLPEYILDQICGHAPLTEGARYGEGAVLEVVYDEMMRINFEAVDWSRLQSAGVPIDWKEVVHLQSNRTREDHKGSRRGAGSAK